MSGVPNSPYGPTGMLIVDKGVTLIVSKQKVLQMQYVQLAPNTRLKPVFLKQNARLRLVFLLLSVRPVSQHPDMRFASHYKITKPASSLWPS